uniref:Uncharacterized protein n=1 Tax=Glossina austeni TaxID=7395 RepID=A0A1A9UWW3_GLOAU
MCSLLTKALDSVNDPLEFVDLAAISQLAVAINTGGDFFTPILSANFISRIHKYIKTCRTREDARLLAICILNLQPFIDYEILNAFKERISILLQNGVISANCPKVIIKLLNMLNIGVWSHKNAALIRDLLAALKPCVKQLEHNVLKNVCRIYLYYMEPATLHEPLAEALEDLLNRNISPETLAYFVPFSDPVRRNALINTFKTFINSSEVWEQSNSLAHLFSALRALKISDVAVCDKYWNGVLKELNCASQADIGQLRFLRHCHRYMNFNNNLGGTYRHLGVEQRLSQMAITAIEYDIFGRIPQIFARLASFVFAYGRTPHFLKKYPNILLSKVINMAEQFTPGNCFLISLGFIYRWNCVIIVLKTSSECRLYFHYQVGGILVAVNGIAVNDPALEDDLCDPIFYKTSKLSLDQMASSPGNRKAWADQKAKETAILSNFKDRKDLSEQSQPKEQLQLPLDNQSIKETKIQQDNTKQKILSELSKPLKVNIKTENIVRTTLVGSSALLEDSLQISKNVESVVNHIFGSLENPKENISLIQNEIQAGVGAGSMQQMPQSVSKDDICETGGYLVV